MEVFEINFNNPDISDNILVIIYSTLGITTSGELIKLINIETHNHSREMVIEIFGNGNFFNRELINDSNDNLNIFSFKCISDIDYFIKINTHEFREINVLDENNESITEEVKIDLLFYGIYHFNSEILNFIDKKKFKKVNSI